MRTLLNRFLPLLALMVFLLGCGAERYERRFRQNTLKLLASRVQAEESLADTWSRQGIQFSPPVGFEEQPIPPEGLETVELPSGLALELPGILGIFTGEAAADISEHETSDLPARIAILSNREFLEAGEAEEGIDPRNFNEILESTLAEYMSDELTPGRSVEIGGSDFQPSLEYVLYRYQTTDGQDVPYDVSLYLHEHSAGEIQVAIVVIAPDELAEDEPLEQQLPLALQTLRIEDGGE